MAKKANNPAKNKDAGLSLTAFAALPEIDVSRQRVAQAIKDGVLSDSVKITKKKKSTVYKINREKGVKEWRDNIDPSKQRDQNKAAATRDLGGNSSSYQKAKAAKEVYAAKLMRLEFEVKAKKYVPADIIKAESFKTARRVRDSILAVPDRVASEVSTMDDPRKINIYLKEQLASALKDLGDLNAITEKRT